MRQRLVIRLLIIITVISSHINGQDIIEERVLEEFKSTSNELDSLIEAFVVIQEDCIGEKLNTNVSIFYEDSVIGDTSAITIEVIHSRNMKYGEVRGFINYNDYVVFLFLGAEKLSLIRNCHRLKTFNISQRITFGNYMVRDADTLFMVGSPYRAQWVFFELDGKILDEKIREYPCDIHNEKRLLNDLRREGWRYRSK